MFNLKAFNKFRIKRFAFVILSILSRNFKLQLLLIFYMT